MPFGNFAWLEETKEGNENCRLRPGHDATMPGIYVSHTAIAHDEILYAATALATRGA